jgi:hypothetical protein
MIDLVGSSAAGECVLIMIDDREWDGSKNRLVEVQDKLNTYLAYVTSGRLYTDFPQMKGKPVKFQLDCRTPPDASVQNLLRRAREMLQPYGIADVGYNVR